MPRPTRWKGCVNGLKGRVRACFICPPIRLTSTPSKWPGPKLSSSCARLKRALWKHSMRRLLRPYKLFLRAMLKASSSMSDSVYDPYGNRYNATTLSSISKTQDITLRNQLSTEAVDKLGLTNLESNSRPRLEVDWLFFAQGDSVTDSRYRTET